MKQKSFEYTSLLMKQKSFEYTSLHRLKINSFTPSDFPTHLYLGSGSLIIGKISA